MTIGVSTLGQALAQIERFKDQQVLLDMLGTQLSTGKKTQKFSGLSQDVLTSQRARADIKSLDNYVNNIDNAERRIGLMLHSIEEFKAQAENFSGLLVGFSQQSKHQEGEIVYYDDPSTPNVIEQIPVGMDSSEPTVELKTLTDYAEKISELFVDLLNQKDGDRYLLSGAQTLSQPVADTSTLDAALNTLFSEWKSETITTTDFIADIQDRTTTNGNADALTDTIVGYNSVLSSGNAKDIFVRIDETSEVNYTALATETAFRDIMVAVSYIKNENLGPVIDQVDPDTLAVVNEGAPGANADEMKDNFFEVFNALVQRR